MRCWRVPRFASTLLALALALGLAACGDEGPIVPAPVVAPQPHAAALPAPPVTAAPLPAPPSAGKIKVALLVPLSGPNAGLGNAMLQAAQLALFTTGSDRLTLLPRDTAGSGGAAGAAQSAVTGGAQLLLGPLLANEVEALRPVAAAAHINVIAFSTATQLAGGNVFLMGFLPRQEITREVSFAHDKGLARFAALAPNSPYGHLTVAALRAATAANGSSVVAAEFFDPQGSDLDGAIRRLLPPTANTPPPLSPAPPPAASSAAFDALLLPEGGARLKDVGRRLKAAGLESPKVRLLGSGLWDDPSIAGEPALYGGWFAASPPDARAQFESRFQATYGHPPPRLASLAFDAAALAAVLAKNGGPDPFSRDAILNPAGFTGVDGLFRFTPQGLVQRGLAVIEVEAQGDVVVNPAPQSFENVGF